MIRTYNQNDRIATSAKLVGIFVAVSIFVFSLFVSQAYYAGDQRFYHLVYDNMSGLDFVSAFSFYTNWLSSVEVVHFAIVWSGSNLGIEKDILMSVINGLLAYLAFLVMIKQGAKYYVASIILASNFYIFVLYFAAERLKISTVFLFASLLYMRNIKIAASFAGLSILSHSQAILYYAPFVANITSNIKAFATNKRNIFAMSLGLVLVVVAIYIIWPQVQTKALRYYQTTTVLDAIVEISRTLVFLALSLLYGRDKKNILFAFMPILVAVILFGGDRVNIVGYMMFLYFCIGNRGGVNIAIIATQLYFMYTGFQFLDRIFRYGTGFLG